MTNYKKVAKGLCPIALARVVKRRSLEEGLRAAERAALAVEYLESRELLRIPELPLGLLMGDAKVEIVLESQCYEDGMLPLEHALALLSLIRMEQPGKILEIGTYMGHTTRALARNLPEAEIHTVDLPRDFSPEQDRRADMEKDDFHLIAQRQVGREFLGTEYARRIHQHFADTAEWDFAPAKGADCFFIDGGHSYDYCRHDTEKCLEAGNGKGLFFWHDCDDAHPGVIRFLNEWREKGHEVVRIRETCLAYWKAG